MNEPSLHPELSISSPSMGVVELKVENWNILGCSVGRKIKQSAIDLVIVLLFTFSCFELRENKSHLYLLLWICLAFLYIYNKSTQVLHESIFVVPRHGIQLETHRGLKFSLIPAFPLRTKRRFIPLTSVRDIVINEGFRRWDVRYYLCIIRDTGSEVVLEVAFENLLPHLPILECVHQHIHKILSQASTPTQD
ncbi:GPI-GlcNAc transferase complex, PIG-H component-domain-containing protein [Gautieria morchelliformis]|nr:GPI-GlcNAc transferase complex, PIG-H component-domain-containing protein [Gautieria morchelliformis]